MKRILVLLFLILLKPAMVNAAEVFLLDENSFTKEAYNNNPTMELIRSSLLSSGLSESEILEKFQPQLEGDLSHFKSTEGTSAPFPITSPISEFSLGVTKDFSYGVSLGAFHTMQKRKYGTFGTDAKTAVSAELTMDLYKDIFGRTSRAQIYQAEYDKEVAKIQSEIDKKIFLVNLHKIYWALILNEEAIKISKNLLEISKKQEEDAQKRFKNGIADAGEVARQASQSASRQTEIYNLYNKKELYILSLKELLPSIAANKVELSEYDFAEKEGGIGRLINVISQNEYPPMQYTFYDDIIKHLTKSYRQQRKITNAYSDVDFKLYSRYEQSDRDQMISNTYGDPHNYDDNNYEVGVRLTVPLGKAKRKSKNIKRQIEKSKYLASTNNSLAKIESYHTQTIANIKLLKSALENQKNNAAYLQKSLEITKKKYNQARIPLRDLIEDQNLYLQSLLRAIEIKSLIINQTLNYTTVFTDIPLQEATLN